MKDWEKKFVTLVFLLVLFIPFYAWIVQVVNALSPDGFEVSLALRSSRKSDDSGVFQVGDTLFVVAESRVADRFELAVYENASVILTKRGEFSAGEAVVDILLSPPLFNAGTAYVVVLDVFAFNDPIPGVYRSDSVSSVFEVVHASTELGLEVEYDGLLRSLRLNASLTDVDRHPVANETLSFSLQFPRKKQSATEGWIPLGTAVTDFNGSGRIGLAFGLKDGDYRVKAFHKGNRNYGASKTVVDVTVFSNSSSISFGFSTESDLVELANVDSMTGSMTIGVSSSSPYALLPMDAWASYTTDVPLTNLVAIMFYLDDLLYVEDYSGFLGGVGVDSSGPPYIYEGSLVWSPSIVGSHKIIAGIVNGTITDVIAAMLYGTGLIDTAEASINVQPCPSNVVLDFPEVWYGDSLPVTAVVSKPRPFEAQSNDLYVTTTLAPLLSYNDVQYVIDDPVESVPAMLYRNDALVSSSYSDANGLVHLELSEPTGGLTLKVVVDDSGLLYHTVERVLSLGKTRVYDRSNAAVGPFNMNFTVDSWGSEGSFFTGVESRIKAETSFLNHPVQNLSMSVISARVVSSSWTDGNGWVSVPASSDYLRVHNVTDLVGDLNDDGSVNGSDVTILAYAWDSRPGWSNWNVDADLNHDNHVDMTDANILNVNGGHKSSVLFNNDQEVRLDSAGFGRIPSGVSSLVFMGPVTADAFVEFFETDLDASVATDNLGGVGATWTPATIGRYVVHVGLPRKFDLGRAFGSQLFGVDALCSLVEYVDVTKRPVDLSVSFTPADPTLDTTVTMIASVLDVGLGVPAQDVLVEFYVNNTSGNYVLMGSSYTNSSGVATFSWLPRNYFESLGFNADFVLRVRAAETSVTQMAEKAPIHVDARIKTRLQFLNGEAMNVGEGIPFTLWANLTKVADGTGIGSQLIDLYRNETQVDPGNPKVTDSNGIVRWDLTVSPAGVYIFKAVFQGNGFYESSSSLDGQITYTRIDLPGGEDGYAVDATSTTSRVGYDENTVGYCEWRTYLSFNTEPIIDTVSVVSARLGVKVAVDGSATDFGVAVCGGQQPILGDALDIGDWDVGSVFQSSVSTSTIEVGDYASWVLDPSQINKVGKTQFRLDSVQSYDNSYVDFFMSERGGGDRPWLSVVYRYAMYVASEARIVVSAGPVPTTVSLDVQPRDFKPGDRITLRATVRNATSGDTLTGIKVKFYKVSQNGDKTSVGSNRTVNGVAEMSYNYPSSGAYAFLAETPDCRQVATSAGLMLTASTPTTLLLNLGKEASSFKHVISGSLKSGSSGVSGKSIRVSVNGTVKATNNTNAAGQFTVTLNMEPLNNNPTTYQIQAMFDGDNPTSATAYAVIDGTEYTVSTTVRYGYKPAMNATALTVSPQSTEATQPTKTPEQLQENSGVHVWGEPVGIFPPWYKIHIEFPIAALSFAFHSWIGIVGFGLQEIIGLENILSAGFDVPPEMLDAVQSARINGVTTAIATFAAGAAGTMLSRTSPWYFIILTSYIIGMSLAMMGIYALADKYTARSILFGMGFALVGFVLGLFALEWLTNWHRSMLTSYLTGSSPQTAAVKATVNVFMSTTIKALVIGLGLLILDTPFFAASLALGIFAITLALSISV